MKKLLLILAMMITAVAGANALTLKEAFKELESMPDLEGVESNHWHDIGNGWLSSIPLENAEVTYKVHQVGNGQTVYYGSKVEDLAKQLPKDYLILSGTDFQNLIYFYANPIDKHSSEILIMIDQAYQGKTTAVLAKVSNQIIKALKAGEVKFTSTHKIVVNAPILVCD